MNFSASIATPSILSSETTESSSTAPTPTYQFGLQDLSAYYDNNNIYFRSIYIWNKKMSKIQLRNLARAL